MGNMQKLTKALLGATALTILSTGSAYGLGTTANDTVSNTFTLDYAVSGTPQDQIVPAAPTNFVVDRFVDLTVASTGTTTVAPGSSDETLEYTVTNTGNGTQGYLLSLFEGVDGTDDDFDADSLTITYFIDADGSGSMNGSEILETYTLGTATNDLAPDETMYVTVTGDIDAAAVDTTESDVTLIAKTTIGGGSTTEAVDDTTTASSTNDMLAEDTVLGDDAGTSQEVDFDGDHSAVSSYIVAAPILVATKTVAVVSTDGSDCTSFATATPAAPNSLYSVPGACVEYTIEVVNSGTTDAEAFDLVDDLVDTLHYQHAEISGFTASVSPAPASAFTIDGTAISGTSTPADCSVVTVDCVVSLTDYVLEAGDTGTLTIRALIQ